MNAQTQRSAPAPADVLAKAVPRAAVELGVAQKDLGRILGVSEASISRLCAGRRPLDPKSKEGELALLFLRVFRSLDALVGGRADAAREWFHAENGHLGGAPVERVATVEGLVHVAEYLDAMRGKL